MLQEGFMEEKSYKFNWILLHSHLWHILTMVSNADQY